MKSWGIPGTPSPSPCFAVWGVLGKEELLRRPGRPSGIKMETPDAQMLGTIRLHLALSTHPGTTKQGKVAQRAKRFLTPLCTYHKMPLDAIKLHPPAVTAPKDTACWPNRTRTPC